MYKIAEERFQKLYQHYAGNMSKDYVYYYNSVLENGESLFDVPRWFLTNEMIMTAFETPNNPIHLMTRYALENCIVQKYRGQITKEDKNSYFQELLAIIGLKYERIFMYNAFMQEKKVYVFFDFFRAVTEFYSGMDTINYVYLYRGFPIPIRIKKNGRKQNFKLLYDVENKILRLIRVSVREYKLLWQTLDSKLKAYYGDTYFMNEYCWEYAPTDEMDIPILQDGEYYETFKTIEEDGVVYDFSHSCIMGISQGVVDLCVPDEVWEITENCFRGNKNLKRIKFSSSLDYIPQAAFMDCESLEEIDLSLVKTKIIVASAAFCNCKSLKRIDMSKIELDHETNLTFAYCTGIESIAGLTFLGQATQMIFFHCDNLKELTNEKCVDYGKFGLAYCINLSSVTLRGHMIPEGLFCGCENIKNLEIVNEPGFGVQFGDYCCAGCKSITKIDDLENGVKIGNYSFADCTNLEKVAIPKNKEWNTQISKSSFEACPNVVIEWTDNSCCPNKETIEDYWIRKSLEADKINECNKAIGKKAKDIFLKIFEEIRESDIDNKHNVIGQLFKKRGRYIGGNILYILKYNICTWDEFLKLGRVFYECIPFSDINMREIIVSWAKSCTIQSYLQAPIHNKYDAIQQIYDILKLAHCYFENGMVVYGENSRVYASNDFLYTYFDYYEIEVCATEDEKKIIGDFCSLSDIRMSYLMQLYILKHLIDYNRIRNNIAWDYEYANREISKLNRYVNSFGKITPLFLLKLCRHTWQQFLKDDIEQNYEDLGYRCDVEKRENYYISYDSSNGEICWDTESIFDICKQYDDNEDSCCDDDFYDNDDLNIKDNGVGRYSGSYAQDKMGCYDDDKDTIFDVEPDAY